MNFTFSNMQKAMNFRKRPKTISLFQCFKSRNATERKMGLSSYVLNFTYP